MPRVDLAVGYSFRDASLNTGTGLNVYSSYEPQSLLKDDSFIFESTATLGFYYQIQNSTIILDAGYRYKSDLGSGTYGTDQKGVYGRLGYTYSW